MDHIAYDSSDDGIMSSQQKMDNDDLSDMEMNGYEDDEEFFNSMTFAKSPVTEQKRNEEINNEAGENRADGNHVVLTLSNSIESLCYENCFKFIGYPLAEDENCEHAAEKYCITDKYPCVELKEMPFIVTQDEVAEEVCSELIVNARNQLNVNLANELSMDLILPCELLKQEVSKQDFFEEKFDGSTNVELPNTELVDEEKPVETCESKLLSSSDSCDLNGSDHSNLISSYGNNDSEVLDGIELEHGCSVQDTSGPETEFAEDSSVEFNSLVDGKDSKDISFAVGACNDDLQNEISSVEILDKEEMANHSIERSELLDSDVEPASQFVDMLPVDTNMPNLEVDFSSSSDNHTCPNLNCFDNDLATSEINLDSDFESTCIDSITSIVSDHLTGNNFDQRTSNELNLKLDNKELKLEDELFLNVSSENPANFHLEAEQSNDSDCKIDNDNSEVILINEEFNGGVEDPNGCQKLNQKNQNESLVCTESNMVNFECSTKHDGDHIQVHESLSDPSEVFTQTDNDCSSINSSKIMFAQRSDHSGSNSKKFHLELPMQQQLQQELNDETISNVSIKDGSSILEKFLVPSLLVNRKIATPFEDHGFDKVPGYATRIADVSGDYTHSHKKPKIFNDEENLPSRSPVAGSETILLGELEQARALSSKVSQLSLNRPNILTGLSKPEINKEPDCISEMSHVNSNQILESVTESENSDSDFSLLRKKRSRPQLFYQNPESLALVGNNLEGVKSNVPMSLPSPSPFSIPASHRPNTLNLSLPNRPTSWSHAPPPVVKHDLPKRPTSLNITVASHPIIPVDPESRRKPQTERNSKSSPQTGLSMEPISLDIALPSANENTVHPAVLTPPLSSNINLSVMDLGKVPPFWLPDASTTRCMQCETRFTFTKRRHHCRACGKIFCSGCCSIKVRLRYLDQREGRVCSRCYQDLLRAQFYETNSSTLTQNLSSSSDRTNTSVVTGPPALSMPTSVLRKEGSARSNEPKQVKFSDGTQPGSSISTIDESSNPSTHQQLNLIPDTRSFQNNLKPVQEANQIEADLSPPRKKTTPPILLKDDEVVKCHPLKNLTISVCAVELDCCMKTRCWCFVTHGMCMVGQDEIVVLMERLLEEEAVPEDILDHLTFLYRRAAKGKPVSHLGHSLIPDGTFLGSADHAGFIYIQPTFQCLQKIPVPEGSPYLFAILIHKSEIPWAAVFPIRLMLRLGAEYRYYPCPLVSIRFRPPVYCSIGHTIMNLLVDLRSYRYKLPCTPSLVVQMEEKKTYIKLPQSNYSDIMKAVNNNNDHVMAFEANLSLGADSHLVCVQNADGKYQTQAINVQNKPRKITGASFVVFNGALKSSSGMKAKCSIVEDGLMVQVSSDTMKEMKQSLVDGKDYSIECGRMDAIQPEEWIVLKWVNDSKRPTPFFKISSPVDRMSLSDVDSRRVYSATDYVCGQFAIRWTETFYIGGVPEGRASHRLEESLAQICCMVLTSHFDSLELECSARIGLRVTVLPNEQGVYKIGANGQQLPNNCKDDLDAKLLPILDGSSDQTKSLSTVLELCFYIVEHEAAEK